MTTKTENKPVQLVTDITQVQNDEAYKQALEQLTKAETAIKGVIIKDDTSLAGAVEITGKVKQLNKLLEERRTKYTGPLNEIIKAINALFKQHTGKLAEYEQALKNKIIAYNREQDRLRREREEAERRRREAAEKAAAEKARKEALKNIKAAFKKAGMSDRAVVMFIKTAIGPGLKLDELGMPDLETLAAELAARKEVEVKQPDPVPVEPVIPSESLAPPKQNTIITDSGAKMTRKKERKWRLIDISKVPAEYLKLDEKTINKLVKAGIPAIEGIEIYFEDNIAIGG